MESAEDVISNSDVYDVCEGGVRLEYGSRHHHISLQVFWQLFGAVAKLRKAITSLVMSAVYPSVRPSIPPSTWNNSAPTGRIFMKF